MAEISISELACVYSALILYDDDIEITGEKMAKIIPAAKVNVEALWPDLFAKALQGCNIGDLSCKLAQHQLQEVLHQQVLVMLLQLLKRRKKKRRLNQKNKDLTMAWNCGCNHPN